MNAHVTYTTGNTGPQPVDIQLPLSKSLSNRRLVIDALAGIETPRHAVAECDDTNAMLSALAAGTKADINIGAAGTAMRFLTAYYSIRPGYDITLDGSERMRQRPIRILVDTLRRLGADITYLSREGYPPLHIKGRILDGGSIEIDAGVSSQYISALLMIAPAMTLGLQLTLKGTPVSQPYIAMTIAMMANRGVTAVQQQSDQCDHSINIPPALYRDNENTARVEADWSAASYWYEVTALTGQPFTLKGLTQHSLQGDACISTLFEPLGVNTTHNNDNSVTITRRDITNDTPFEADMQLCPDLAQTVVATCCALGRRFRITGLSTLPIKETDRLEALRCELAKLGYHLTVDNGHTISWDGTTIATNPAPTIATYNDHRMAMSLAPLAAAKGHLTINNPEVVTKSYPDFWQHLACAGYQIQLS